MFVFKDPNTYPVLLTERLRLRPMSLLDSEDVVRWRNSPHVEAMNRNSGKLSVESHMKWFNESRENRLDYIIEEISNNRSVGSVSFVIRPQVNQNIWAELGKYIGESDALGKGLAKEATKRWIRFGFEVLVLELIFARTKRENLANIEVNKKMGLEIGEFPPDFNENPKDWLFMTISRNKWLTNYNG